MGKIEGDGNDGDTEAGQDEGGDVRGVIGGLGVTEDGAVRMAHEDDTLECLA